jgi:hypothetical protein
MNFEVLARILVTRIAAAVFPAFVTDATIVIVDYLIYLFLTDFLFLLLILNKVLVLGFVQ